MSDFDGSRSHPEEMNHSLPLLAGSFGCGSTAAAQSQFLMAPLPHLELSDRVLRFDLGEHVLLTSTTNGAIDLLPLKLLHEMPDQTVSQLAQRGYFLKDDEAERHLRNADRARDIPIWSYLVLTKDCNLACIYCYEQKVAERGKQPACYCEGTTKPITQMSVGDADKVLSRIRELQCAAGIRDDRMKIVLFGGEPLLAAPPLLSRILERSRAHRWSATVITNGTLIPRHKEVFAAYRDCISDFRISLDGAQEMHDQRRPTRSGTGTYHKVLGAVKTLLREGFTVNMMTIVGKGNVSALEDLVGIQQQQGLLAEPRFSWRLNSSHDYAEVSPLDDELTEADVVSKLIGLWDAHPELHGKMKFETFRYLGHITSSFEWLGRYKTYSGPKLAFCDSQKEFYYVFTPDLSVYHCPRSLGIPAFRLGDIYQFNGLETVLKGQTIFDREGCRVCNLNTLCGGYCPVRMSNFDEPCRDVALQELTRFVHLMRDKILSRAEPQRLVAVNDPWF